ncbi:MAG: histidine kinase [Bacteroidales bacterium]|nr:histidine kinase [Bacteroidales bacterium]
MNKENKLYVIVWASFFALFALRIVVECIYHGAGYIDFGAILRSWLSLVPFLLLFAVHNYLLAPLFVSKKQVWLYVSLTVILLAVFIVAVVLSGDGHAGPPPEIDAWDPGFGPGPEPSGARPLHPASLKALVGIMMVGANLGVKIYFRDEGQKRELERLEKENLQYQLEYLRYQINPHFFMNTLNNIHALVDFDPEKAKESIVELSKLMRHVLYDSDKATIPLSQELDFLDNYVSLMRLRYPENALIEFLRPDSDEGAEVPPLVFASFVENAFKHGFSSGKDSFIRVSVSIEGDKLLFKCVNSRPAAAQAPSGGVGLNNARKRLQLLYGSDYTLHVDNASGGVYDITLLFPKKPAKTV